MNRIDAHRIDSRETIAIHCHALRGVATFLEAFPTLIRASQHDGIGELLQAELGPGSPSQWEWERFTEVLVRIAIRNVAENPDMISDAFQSITPPVARNGAEARALIDAHGSYVSYDSSRTPRSV